MKRGLTAAFTTWLALVALQTLASSSFAPARVKSLFQDVDSIVERALDPSVPAIPDLRAGGNTGTTPAPPGKTRTPPTTGSSATAPTNVKAWRPV